MKIEFRKISQTKSKYEYKDNLLRCDGVFFKNSDGVVLFDIQMSGSIDHDCDICGDSFRLDIDENINLKLSDGISNDEDLDIIECQDHVIDFDEIVFSEINSIKSDYHYCTKCKN